MITFIICWHVAAMLLLFLSDFGGHGSNPNCFSGFVMYWTLWPFLLLILGVSAVVSKVKG